MKPSITLRLKLLVNFRVRNFHCYTFTDFRDGALFGPEVGTVSQLSLPRSEHLQGASSVDIAHIAQASLFSSLYFFPSYFCKGGL
jgi:hypothetical protein